MAALESPIGIMNAYEVATAFDRMLGCAISGGGLKKSMHIQIQRDGVEMMTARSLMFLVDRAAGGSALTQCNQTSMTWKALRLESTRT